MTPIATWFICHAVGLFISLGVGWWATSRAVSGLRQQHGADSDNSTGTAGTFGAGTMIGLTERFLMYGSIVAGHPGFIAVVLALKSVVRYPEVKHSADRGADAPPGAFQAEYYLVGTLVSTCFGTTPAVAANWLAHAIITALV